jgi:hypothetical protein
MGHIKTAILGISLFSAATAGATLKCSTVGPNLPENRFVIEATVETNWLGTVITYGTFSYTDPATSQTRTNQFACLPPDKDSLTRCGAIEPDENIERIGAHPVIGFSMHLKGQQHEALLNCKEVSVELGPKKQIFR